MPKPDYSSKHFVQIAQEKSDQGHSYRSDTLGSCAGYAQKGIEAFLTGGAEGVEYQEYKDSIDYIAHTGSLVKEIQEIRKKVLEEKKKDKETDSKPLQTKDFPLEEQKAQAALALVEQVELYQNPRFYPELFGRALTQANTVEIAEFAGSKALKERGGLVKIDSQIEMHTPDGWNRYMSTFTKLLEEKPFDMALKIENHKHCFACCFDQKTRAWTLINVANLPPKPFSPEESKAFISALQESSDSNSFGFQATLLVTGDRKLEAEAFVTRLKEQKEYQETHAFAPEDIKRVAASNMTLAHLAAEFNDLEALDKIKAEKPDNINVLNERGLAPIHYAIRHGHNDALRKLIDANANVDRQDKKNKWTPLHWAVASSDVSAVKILLDAKADLSIEDPENRTPFHMAAYFNLTNMLRELAALGMDVNKVNSTGKTALHYAAENGQVNAVRTLLELGADPSVRDENGRTAFHLAAEMGHVNILNEFKKAKVDPNVPDNNGATPIHVAAEQGRTDFILALAGLMTETRVDVNRQDSDRMTALHYAVEKEHLNAVNALLQIPSFNPNLPDRRGNIGLHLAAERGSIDIAIALIPRSDINIQDAKGNTALHLAIRSGHVDVTRELIKAGADLMLKDREGLTPLELAREVNPTIARFLESEISVRSRSLSSTAGLMLKGYVGEAPLESPKAVSVKDKVNIDDADVNPVLSKVKDADRKETQDEVLSPVGRKAV